MSIRAVVVLGMVVLSLACRNNDDKTGEDTDNVDTSQDCAEEETICDGLDDDCNGEIDEGLSQVWYTDSDNDGYGDSLTEEALCETPDSGSQYGGDCDDADETAYPGAVEVCDGDDEDCDEEIDEGLSGQCESTPSDSCLTILTENPDAADGAWWIDPLGTEPVEVYCDMSGGGWTLVYRGTNSGGVIENGEVETAEALGMTPITPESEGNHKLHDDVINALRSGLVENDLKLQVIIAGTPLAASYHPSACTLQSEDPALEATDICNESTTTGMDATDRISSGHHGSLSRWYVDSGLGYIWGSVGTHVGPISGGTSLSSPPYSYCTWYDSRVCPSETALEVWAY